MSKSNSAPKLPACADPPTLDSVLVDLAAEDRVNNPTSVETPRKVKHPKSRHSHPDDRQTNPWDITREHQAFKGIKGRQIVDRRYQIERLIGQGGMARIFEVRHRALGKNFALKLVHDQFVNNRRIRDFFVREGHLASQLNHPNVVQVTDFGVDERLGPFLVMELLKGRALSEVMAEGTPLRIPVVLDLTAQIAEALQYMHQQDVIHCDIKPENIFVAETSHLLRRRSKVKIIDFGLARREALGARLDQSEMGGTPVYMAPEQMRGAAPQPPMDIYALGVLLYEMLAGNHPFANSSGDLATAKQSLDVTPATLRWGSQGSRRIDEFVVRLLALDPGARPRNMEQVIFELRTLIDMLGLRHHPDWRIDVDRSPQTRQRVEEGWLAFEHSPCPQFCIDSETRVLVCNQALAWYMRCPVEQLIGKRLGQTRFADFYPTLEPDVLDAAETGNALRKTLFQPMDNGRLSTSLLWLVPLEDQQEQFISFNGIILPLSSKDPPTGL